MNNLQNLQIKRLNQSIPKLSIGGVAANTLSGAFSGLAAGGPIGAAIGGGISLLGGIIGESAEKKQARLEEENRQKLIRQNSIINNANRLAMSNPQGYNQPLYLSKGGTTGGTKGRIKYNKNTNSQPTQLTQPTQQSAFSQYGYIPPIQKGTESVRNLQSTKSIDIADNIARSIAGTPQTFNKLINAVISPFTQFGTSEGNPLYRPYWDNIANAWEDALVQTPEELDNMYKTVGYDTAEAAVNLMMPRAIPGIVKNVPNILGKATTKVKTPKFIKTAVNKTVGLVDDVLEYGYGIKRNTGVKSTTPKIKPKQQSYNLDLGDDFIPKNSGERVFYQGSGTPPSNIQLPQKATSHLTKSGSPKPFDPLSARGRVNTVIDPQAPMRSYIPKGELQKQVSILQPKISNNKPILDMSKLNTTSVNRGNLIPSTSKTISNLDESLNAYYQANKTKLPGETFEEYIKWINSNPAARKKALEHVGYSSSFSKGGTNKVIQNGNLLPIAPGVTKVKANTKGTDTVKTQLNNKPVYVDNNEHIVNVDGTEVVISDDLGETKLHKELLKTMPSKQANKIMADRAIQLQNINNGNRLTEGGDPSFTYFNKNQFPVFQGTFNDLDKYPFDFKFDIYNEYFDNYRRDNYYKGVKIDESFNKPTNSSPNKEGIVGEQPTTITSNNIPVNNVVNSAKPTTLNIPLSNIAANEDYKRANTYAPYKKFGYDKGSPKIESQFKDFNLSVLTGTLNPTTENVGVIGKSIFPVPPVNISNKSIERSKTTTNPLATSLEASTFGEKFKTFKNNVLSDPSKIAGFADLGLMGTTMLSNAIAARQARKNTLPDPILNQAILQDVNANADIFENQRIKVDNNYRNLNNIIAENSTNANSALSKMGNIQADKVNALSSISAGQLADVKGIRNQNLNTLNQTANVNNQLINANNMNRFNLKNEVIQMGLGLRDSSLDTAAQMVNNLKLENRDNKALEALAASYQINWNPADGIEALKAEFLKRLSSNIQAQNKGISTNTDTDR